MSTMRKPQNLELLVDKLTDNVAEGVYQTIQMLNQITDMSERFYVGSHSRWVGEKSEEIAKVIGMKKEYIFQTKVAAQLHDLGKFVFRDSCLHKNSREMNKSELEQYKLHPQIGASILDKHANMEEISKIVLQHHEKLDGSGFPNNLKGNEIHISAQIIGIVDTYHNHVFKKTISDCSKAYDISEVSNDKFIKNTSIRHQASINYLIAKSKSLFDRQLVDAFVDIIENDRLKANDGKLVKLHLNGIKPGMVVGKNYSTSFGLLIAAKGDVLTAGMIKVMRGFSENGELPIKILVQQAKAA